VSSIASLPASILKLFNFVHLEEVYFPNFIPILSSISRSRSRSNTMDLLERANDAFNINPPLGADDHISEHVSTFLWAVTAIYIVSFVHCTFDPP